MLSGHFLPLNIENMPLILNGRFLLKVRGPGGLTEMEQHAHKPDAHAFQTLSLPVSIIGIKFYLNYLGAGNFLLLNFVGVLLVSK